MTTLEKIAYLKGLCEGMDMDSSTREGKLFGVIIDVLGELAADVADLQDGAEDLADCVDELTDGLSSLEDEFYECVCGDCDDCSECDGCCEDCGECDEDDEPVFYTVECPGCGFSLTVDEDILAEGSFECPECGEVIDFGTAEVHAVDFDDDEDDEDELPF